MPNDQLTRAERIRLEVLAQAISLNMTRPTDLPGVLKRAEEIEKWLKEARADA